MMLSTNDAKQVHCSIVIPVFNSEHSLSELCNRIDKLFSGLKTPYEIILVDDNSSDNSWEVMNNLSSENSAIKIIRLMKNFGQHNATLCGFWYVSGDFIVTMDDDLQHSPEDIPLLLEKIKEGYDAVIASFDTKQDSLIKCFASRVMRDLTSAILKKPKEIKLSSFRIFTRKIVEVIREIKTPNPYIVGMLFSLTTDVANVMVSHSRRQYGQSNYSFFKLLSLSFNLIINYSALPIRFFSLIGCLIALGSFAMGIYYILHKLFNDNAPAGWTTVVVLLSFFNGLLLIILSFMGEYFRRIINETSGRKQFVVRDKKL